MYPDAIPGFSLVWWDAFGIESNFPPAYHRWEVIKVEPNQGTNEVQWYESGMDVTYMYRTMPHGPVGGGAPSAPDQLFLMPQKKNGKWVSARVEGKEAYGCPDGKQLILQADLRVGNASSDRQNGIWPAFWALGESRLQGGAGGRVWPDCGEWDIMETSDGHDWTLASLHWGRMKDGQFTGNKGSLTGPRNNYKHTDFHTWRIKVDRRNSDWKKQTIQWFMDGKQFHEVKGSDVGNLDEWKVLAHQKYYPVLNVAVGSNFPENKRPSDKTATGIEAGMIVNYVAFYVSD
ncbi:endo-1,3(4)-beta-glucanase [Naviculisporaceae sp. PSN 640]